MPKEPICDRDCFHCPYPDCINDDFDDIDLLESAKRDCDLGTAAKSGTVQSVKYHIQNRKRIAAYGKAYRAANREKYAEKQHVIAEARKAAGISQQMLADELGVSHTLVSLWETGRSPADVPRVLDAITIILKKRIEREKIMENRENKIREFLNEIGIPAHLYGRCYVTRAIALMTDNPLQKITKSVYPQVAKTFSTTPSCVVRAIRHAIEVAWDRGDLDTIQRLFGYTVSSTKGKPTNAEFICMCAEYIRGEIG